MEHWWNGTDGGELKSWETNLPSTTWSTTNPTRVENPGVCGEKPAIRHLHLCLFLCNYTVILQALETQHATAGILNVRACGTYDYHCVSYV